MKKVAGMLVGCVLLAAGCVSTNQGTASSGAGGVSAPKLGAVLANKDAASIPVAAAAGAITVDGKLTDAAWKNAVAVGDFFLGRTQRPEVDTRVLVTYDKDNLYVGVVCAEPNTAKLVATSKGPDGEVWNDDSVEVYLDPGCQKTREFYGFMVNSKNVTYDRKRDATWSGEWKSGASVQEGQTWTVETAIPFKTLGVASKPGLKIGLMVARTRKAGAAKSQTFYLVPCNDEAKDTSVYPAFELK